jgi:hypothetical protein
MHVGADKLLVWVISTHCSSNKPGARSTCGADRISTASVVVAGEGSFGNQARRVPFQTDTP